MSQLWVGQTYRRMMFIMYKRELMHSMNTAWEAESGLSRRETQTHTQTHTHTKLLFVCTHNCVGKEQIDLTMGVYVSKQAVPHPDPHSHPHAHPPPYLAGVEPVLELLPASEPGQDQAVEGGLSRQREESPGHAHTQQHKQP